MHTIPSQVDQVTVYSHGARVTRRAEIPQPAEGWPLHLRLTDLPLTLLDGSVSARLEFPQGGGGYVARELRVEVEPLETAPTAELQVEAQHLKHRIAVLKCRLERLDGDIEKMKKLQPGILVVNDGQAPASFPLRARRAVVELRQKSLAQWLPRRQALRQQLDQVQQQLNACLACSQPPPLQLKKSVIISLRARPEAHAPHLRLLFTYQVEGVRWTPGYSLRFDRDYTLAQLEMRALVCQSTGEDWKDVQLCVSTAEPDRWTDLPRLHSRRLGRQQASVLPGWRPLPPNTEALLADYDGQAAKPRPATTPRFQAGPLHLSDVQVVAVALMSLPPEVSASCFKELGPEQVHAVTLEISRLPQITPGERAEVAEYLGGDLEELSIHHREALLHRIRELLEWQRPAAQPRPAPSPEPVQTRIGASQASSASRKPESVCMMRTTSSLSDLMVDKSAGGSVLESLSPVSPRPKHYRWELSLEQLAFELLYLPGADEVGRGRLQPQTPVKASLKRWKDPASVSEASRLLAKALDTGMEAFMKPLPAGYSRPAAVKAQDWLYRGDSRVTLASDSQYHSVPLLRRQLPAALHWLVVPKVTCDVFRRVELECPHDLALPAGPADLFVGPDYLACVDLPPVAAGESFPLDMGVETAVRVCRNATYKEQTAGMMGGTLQLHHNVRIEAVNHLTRPVRLQVREPVPQAGQGSECKVRMESQWQSLPDNEGQYHWLAMAAGERAECGFSYCIEMSTRLELVGGNRREK